MEQFPDVIELNVGGKLMTTLLSTLTKDPESMLTAMFSGRHVISKDKDGRFFIDCDGHIFVHILNYLRFGSFPPNESIVEVHDVAEYFNIKSLVESLEQHQVLQHRKRIADLKSNLNLQEYEQLKQDAIKNIYSSSESPHEGTLLHIVPNSNFGDHHCGSSSCLLHKVDIILKTDTPITRELKICLGHELSHLGFGRYSYVPLPGYPPSPFFPVFNCDYILLLDYRLVEVRGYCGSENILLVCS